MNWKSLTFVGALIVGAVLVPAAPASAVSAGAPEFCIVEVAPIGDPAKPNTPTCYPSEVARDSSLDSAARALNTTVASIVIGTAYKDQDYAGSSLTFTGANGCSGATYGYPSLSSEWAQSISSARGHNGCWVTLYSATSYGGDRTNCTPTCPGLAL